MAFKEEKKETVKKLTKMEEVGEILEKLEKELGKGTVIGATDKPMDYDYIPTGSLGLDTALGIGGLPRGRIVEFIGPESSGKTTMAIHIIAEAQTMKKDVFCAFVDAEHAFDTKYAQDIGVDLKQLIISQPDNGEQALEVVERLAATCKFDVIVIDSVAALVPKSEVDRDMGESSMGKQAMLMSQAMRKLTPVAAKSGTLIIFLNQIREKIGVMFGSPETTPGGNALKFYASVRLDIRRSVTKENSVMDGEVKVGNQTTIKVMKNKTAPPYRSCVFDILYGQGIDKAGELLDMAVDANILVKKGAFYSYEGANIGQGREVARQYLKSNKEMFDKIKEKLQAPVITVAEGK